MRNWGVYADAFLSAFRSSAARDAPLLRDRVPLFYS